VKKLLKVLKSRFFIGVVCFVLGFLVNRSLQNFNTHLGNKDLHDDDRIPVRPEDFDQNGPHRLAGSMLRDFDQSEDLLGDNENNAFNISPIRREDYHNVYYEIPLKNNESGENKLNVEVKDGMIHIKMDSNDKHFSSSVEQVFSIDSYL
jgi:hypothetical protein